MQIELQGINHCDEHHQLLRDLDLTLASGQCLVVSGRCGSGKSLLFSIICGLIEPQAGRVLFNGQDIATMDEDSELDFRRDLGVVFQVPALLSNLTVRENLMLPLNLYFPDKALAGKDALVEDLAMQFGLQEYLDDRTDELSSGLASLAGFARAMVVEPKCLIWDAPMSETDVQWGDYVYRRLRLLKQQGSTLILFSNRQKIIDELADVTLNLTERQRRLNDAA